MQMDSGFTYTDFETLRDSPLATMGVFLTPACPVQCAHCAVGAFPDPPVEPGVSFLRRIEEMGRIPALVAAAVTGGEPFHELDLLKKVVETFRLNGKRVVVYTSGYWGKAEGIHRVLPVLDLIDGLVVGVDLFHRARIPDADLANALRCAADRGIWIAAQVIDGIQDGAHLEYALSIFHSAFGPEWARTVTLVRTVPSPSCRAGNLDSFRLYRGSAEGFCSGLNGPTLLRDGTLAACCNEDVVLGKGPGVFRVEDQGTLSDSVELLEGRPPLNYLKRLPPAVLLSLAAQCARTGSRVQAGRLCEACWKFVELYASMEDAQKEKFDAMASLLIAAGNNTPSPRLLPASAGITLPDRGGDV